MKNYKKIVSIALSSLMLASSITVLAEQGDIYNGDGSLYKTRKEVGTNKAEQRKVTLGKYLYESANGDLYNFKDANDAYKNAIDKSKFLEDLEKNYEPVVSENTQELKVESVSAINLTTISVVFSGKVDSISKENFSIEGSTVENASLGEDAKTVTLKVSGLAYGQKYTLKSHNILVDAKKVEVADKTFTAPTVNDLWELELTTSAKDNNDKILANGADNAVVTAKLINKVTKEVDTNADDIVLSFSTTYGNLANTRVTVQNGVATVVLVSEFSSKDLVAKIDAQIIDASGDYKDLIGEVVGTKNVYFVTSDSTLNPDEKPALIAAGSNHADRVTLYFNQDVNIDDFVAKDTNGKYRTDVDGNAILITEDSITTEVNITQDGGVKTYTVRGFKKVNGNPKALEAVLDVDREDDTTILVDNKKVDVELIMPSNVGAQTTKASFILTDARKPEATSVSVKDLRTLTVKFSEPIAQAGVKVDGGLIKLDATTPVAFGDFDYNSKTNSWDDLRDIVTVNIGKDTDNNDIYLSAGKHSIQLSSVYDFAGLSDDKNISTSQSLDFTVAADDSVPTATVKVESPEQFRVTFNRRVNGFTDETKVELQKFVKGTGGVEDKWVEVSELNPGTDNYYATVPTLAYNAIPDSSDYVLELENDWTQVYDTTGTKKNYYNDQYRLVIKKDTVTNPTNGKKNAEIVMPLNYVGSPLNNEDITNPAISGFERIEDTNKFNVLMSKPVKLPTEDNAGDTPSQLQNSAIPTPIVEFLGTDKDGNKVTIDGTILGYDDEDGADKIFTVEPSAVLETLVSNGHSSNWTLIVRSISDDVGNTAGTLTHNFKVEVDSVVNKFEVDTVDGIIGTEGDQVIVTFTSPVQYVGNVENAVNVSNYLLDAENLPKGSSIEIDQTSGNSDDGYDTIIISLPAGTLSEVSNVLTVSKNLKSSKDIILTGDYEVEFTSVTQAAIDEEINKAAAQTALSGAITAAQGLHDGAVEGTDNEQYAVGSKTTLQSAIDAAQAVLDDVANKTSTQLTDAKTTLDNAVTAFENGQVAAAGDTTSLASAIASAQSLHDGATEGVASGNYAVGSKTTLQSAIDAAQAVVDATNPSSTAAEVTQAESDLAAAVTTFENGKVE